jgi:uridine phosphorylase
LSEQAWYIGCDESEVAERVILIGDPARVIRLALLLTDVHWITESRGLRTITGTYKGQRVTVAAFGMGAPIAAIVLHELAHLGAKVFLRIGTAMALPPVALGEYLIGVDAVGSDGTSKAYGNSGEPAAADATLVAALEETLAATPWSWRKGRFASFDGFYRDMFPLEPQIAERVATLRESMTQQGVLVMDMESAAIFTVAKALQVKASSLCVATVDNVTQRKLDADEMARLESQLFHVALDVVIRTATD